MISTTALKVGLSVRITLNDADGQKVRPGQIFFIYGSGSTTIDVVFDRLNEDFSLARQILEKVPLAGPRKSGEPAPEAFWEPAGWLLV